MTLDEWLNEQPRGACAALAKQIGVDRSYITLLRQGQRPSLGVAVAIEAATGRKVKIAEWLKKKP